MNTKKIICSLLILILFLILLIVAPIRVFAETRNIYVGDIIALQIENSEFSSEELTEKFKDFEIVEIKEKSGGYSVSVRTFDVGERKIFLGNKEVIINVQSTLDDIDREDIFEGGERITEPGFSFHWRILFYISAGIFVLSGGFVLLKILINIIKRKIKIQTPRQLFLSRSGSLSSENDNYLVDLTYYFKEYLESLYQCRIIGKTSAEIINELKDMQNLETMLAEIQEWLTECDRLKFTGVHISSEEKQGHYKNLIDLVEKIDTQNTQNIQKEGTA